MNQIETFKKTAAEYNNAKAAAGKKTSLSNTLIGQALYIHMQGTLQDRIALKNYVAKGEAGEAFKQFRSRGIAIADYFSNADAVTMKDGSEVTAETIKAGSFENLPAIALSSVYAAIKADAKEANSDETRTKQALALGMESEGVSKEDAKAASDADKQRWLQTGLAMLDAQDAQAANETREQAIARIVAEITALNAGEEVLDALADVASVQAA